MSLFAHLASVMRSRQRLIGSLRIRSLAYESCKHSKISGAEVEPKGLT